MPTYTLISSNVLTTAAASVTFSSIPATFTDLVLRMSAQADGASNAFDNITLTFNGTGTTCLLYTSPSPRDRQKSRMPSSA